MSDPIERTQAIPMPRHVGRIATQNKTKKVRDDGKNPFDELLKDEKDNEDKDKVSKSKKKGNRTKSSANDHPDESGDWDQEVKGSGFIIDVKA